MDHKIQPLARKCVPTKPKSQNGIFGWRSWGPEALCCWNECTVQMKQSKVCASYSFHGGWYEIFGTSLTAAFIGKTKNNVASNNHIIGIVSASFFCLARWEKTVPSLGVHWMKICW